MIQSLYVHIPFCQDICAYCDFCRVKYDHALVDRYLEALNQELQKKIIDNNLLTIYIGGGTPTALNDVQLEHLLFLLQPYTKHVEEYTIEINPETLTKTKADLLKKYHINRASLGIQTFNPRLLKLINRHHDLLQIDQAMSLLLEVGIDNISFDLMYGLPTQSLDDFIASINETLKYPIKHLSLYNLTIEEHSKFGRENINALDSELCDEMYFKALELLSEHGLKQYEISNFAKDGYMSKHNLTYWHYDDFYGIGLGAAGKIDHYRYTNTTNFITYLNGDYVAEEVVNDEANYLFEMLMMGLRLKDGIMLNQTSKNAIIETCQNKLDTLLEQGYLSIDHDILSATKKGYYILNDILVKLLP